METKNKKVISKDYLEEQFYFYDKEFTQYKQNNILNKSDHIYFKPEDEADLSVYDLNIKIKADSDRENYDILSCYKSDEDSDYTLQWVDTTYENKDGSIDADYLSKKDRALVTSHSLRNFIGTDSITTTGNVISGDWQSSIHTEAESTFNALTSNSITIKESLIIPAGASISNEGSSTSESMKVNYLTADVKTILKGNTAINTGSGVLSITSHTNDITIEGNVVLAKHDDTLSNLTVSGIITANNLTISDASTFSGKATFSNGVEISSGLTADTVNAATSLKTPSATIDTATISSLTVSGDNTSATIDTLSTTKLTVGESINASAATITTESLTADSVSSSNVKFTDTFTDGSTTIAGIVNSASTDTEITSFLTDLISDYTEV